MTIDAKELEALTAESDARTTPAAKADVSRLPLFLVFSHNTSQPLRGAWHDYRGGHTNYMFAVMQLHFEFSKPEVTVVQIVNRFSGKVELEKVK